MFLFFIISLSFTFSTDCDIQSTYVSICTRLYVAISFLPLLPLFEDSVLKIDIRINTAVPNHAQHITIGEQLVLLLKAWCLTVFTSSLFVPVIGFNVFRTIAIYEDWIIAGKWLFFSPARIIKWCNLSFLFSSSIFVIINVLRS